MKTLDQITSELITTNMNLDLTQGEIDEKLENELMILEKELSGKVDHYIYRMEKLEQSQEYWTGKAKQARAIASNIESHIDNMKSRIKQTMINLDKKELLGESYKFTIRTTPKMRVNILDETLIPNELKILEQKWVVNKDLIREKLEKGEAVPGAEGERGLTLNIGVNK